VSRLGATITWLGHSAFHIAPVGDGPVTLIDPWLDNPRAPDNARELAGGAEVIVVTHGHFDHLTGTAELATATGATVLASVEVAADLAADGVPTGQLVGFNIGGVATVSGLQATLVQAMHSSSRESAEGRPRELGTSCGVVLEYPGGPVIYNTGDTGVFGDMALIAELYDPSILMLPIGDFYTMGARQASKAVELVGPEWIIPQHYATFDELPGTLEAFREALPPARRERLLAPAPGKGVS
jgi:L-ascorbate metabolism protein UlaG (beta-lactamase superfamily)